MRNALRAALAAGLLAAGTVAVVALAQPASADTQICETYGSTTIGGRYTGSPAVRFAKRASAWATRER